MRLYCHDFPETFSLATEVVESRPGRVRLAQTPLYPGGGGQLADRGLLRSGMGDVAITGSEYAEGGLWHLLADQSEISGSVEAQVDRDFRQMMREMHTATHILNALVFQKFNGALVTGVQMNDDGTARMDFDVPEADNDILRAMEAPLNDYARQNLPVRCVYEPLEQVQATHGLIRSRSVAPPPTDDGLIRIVEIEGIDRQACGGTHMEATGGIRPVKIMKIENKGRHNRRIRLGLAGLGPLA